MSKKIRPIAIYLPQFHPIPENDQWWGKGFTEWTNVTKAVPRFKGHYQPHLPADLGFYDLRVPEVREAQAELASQYGIYGFCYYHYWFNGRRILERPFNEVIISKKPDFPFCLCWANENWTRSWDGKSGIVLLEQLYDYEDDRKHIRYLCKIFEDSRYIKVDNKPVFIVYRTELFPHIQKTAQIWREEAMKYGFPDLYLIRVESFVSSINPSNIGFDAAMEFQPDWPNLPYPRVSNKANLFQRLMKSNSIQANDMIIEYEDLVDTMIHKNRQVKDYKYYHSIVPMWDNSSRRSEGAYIFNGSTPELYKKWLLGILDYFKPYSKDENFMFINAWNEWAEGCHLEPCQRWGRKYLEATKQAITNNTCKFNDHSFNINN